MPDAYSNVKEIIGAKVAAYAYNDAKEVEKAFGFNIRRAGILLYRLFLTIRGNMHLKLFLPRPSLLIKKVISGPF